MTKTTVDLYYTQNEMFTKFVSQTEAGDVAWREMASKDVDNIACVLNIHAKSTIAQLRSAGYVVAKSPRIKPGEIDAILAELEE